MNIQNPEALLAGLLKLPKETEWLEFKQNFSGEENIGKYVSALSNSALLAGELYAYLVFGVENQTHKVVGTNVSLDTRKVGAEDLLHWMHKSLQPPIQITHKKITIEGTTVEILRLAPPYQHPIRFNGKAYIRIESSLHPLNDHPAKEGALWQAVSRFTFESEKARTGLSEQQLESLFFLSELTEGLAEGRSKGNRVEHLTSEHFISPNLEGGHDARNLLVLTSARDLKQWPGFERKGIRLVSYKTGTKFEKVLDIWGQRGYFAAFPNAMMTIMREIPSREELLHGVRRTIYDIPEVAIREILANAIVHQDLTDHTSGPVVEIFKDRVVITNPGVPLIKPDRFVDAPSRSRNTTFANVMRNLGICEQRGSGIDRAFSEIEKAGLPPVSIRVVEGSTVVTIFGPRHFADMTKEERVLACYWHASLCVERNNYMSNASLRTRFKLNDKQYPQVSEVIGEAISAGRIRPLNEDQGNRNARYVPYWF